MGADRAILVVGDENLEPRAVARVLQKIVEQEKPDLVLMGKQAVDYDNNCAGQMIAELLGWPQATFASKVGSWTTARRRSTREVDGGLETLALALPGDRHGRPPPQRATVRVAPGHHEGARRS